MGGGGERRRIRHRDRDGAPERVFSSPDVRTERSIRFVLWNNEETGLNGARRTGRPSTGVQGKEEPAGLGPVP